MTTKANRAKMTWDCETKGCFNQKRRPKIEVFAECFPGEIRLGDVDGIVEINSHFLLLEWKSEVGALKTGQRLLHERLSKIGIYVLVIAGDAELMITQAYKEFWHGNESPWKIADLAQIMERIKKWVAFAQQKKCP